MRRSKIREGVGKAQLDERLSRDADASRFAIDRAQQIDGEVDIHALGVMSGPARLRLVHIRRHVAFEGRSYPGWHHHLVLTAIAYAFLQRERMRRTDQPLTFPGIRAIVQEIFTALLLAQQPTYFNASKNYSKSTYGSDKVVLAR
jgi:hypothetical protein